MTQPKVEPTGAEHFDGPWWRYPVLRLALASGALTGTGFGLAHAGWIGETTEILFYIVAIPLGAYHWAREAIEDLIEEHRVGIDLLMLAAAAGSSALGLWDEAAFLCFLYAAAEGLEEYTYARTRSAIRALLHLAPEKACRLRDGTEEVIPAAALEKGDRFLVRPGESIATDGVVRRGASSLNESTVTGESIPVEKKEGDSVFAATINEQGVLEVEATAAFADSTLAKIIHLVEEAQEQKGRAQQWIERFGETYSPVVLGASVLLLVVPPVLGIAHVDWARRAVVLLVAAAPCALVMSMPVAMAAGITRAGRNGILIKGGAHLESLGAVTIVAFDKTGTLTRGRPVVTEVLPAAESRETVLRLAAAIEVSSAHPLARAIVDAARAESLVLPESSRFESLTGLGARAEIEGTLVSVARPSFFSIGPDAGDIAAHLERLEASGHTVVAVGTPDRIAGLIGLRDEVRPEATAAVAALRDLGVRIVMLSGDNERAAKAVATSLGIVDVFAGLTPEDKVTLVRDFGKGEKAQVLMVGDGVNDAPALAAADCGVAMGAAGSDAALEAADVALMADDLAKLPEAIRLGRRALRISRQNIVFSVALLALLIPSALVGVLSIAAAVLIHEGSELLAVANGLRVGR